MACCSKKSAESTEKQTPKAEGACKGTEVKASEKK